MVLNIVAKTAKPRARRTPRQLAAAAKRDADNKFHAMSVLEEDSIEYVSYRGGEFMSRKLSDKLVTARRKWDAAEGKYEALMDKIHQSSKRR